MPGFTYVNYDGNDERILELLSKLVASSGGDQQPALPSSHASAPSSTWDEVAQRFARYVNAAAAAGKPSQRDAMLAWLNSDGEIHLTKLWRAAGVSAQHDYGGVGGSMTKNMIKARGPQDWYTARLNGKNEWIYKIVRELVEPLKRSFGLK